MLDQYLTAKFKSATLAPLPAPLPAPLLMLFEEYEANNLLSQHTVNGHQHSTLR